MVFRVRSEHGTMVQESSTYGNTNFWDYGTRLFNTRVIRSGNSYEVTVSDYSGNMTNPYSTAVLTLLKSDKSANRPMK